VLSSGCIARAGGTAEDRAQRISGLLPHGKGWHGFIVLQLQTWHWLFLYFAFATYCICGTIWEAVICFVFLHIAENGGWFFAVH